jgi:hypothetical protein
LLLRAPAACGLAASAAAADADARLRRPALCRHDANTTTTTTTTQPTAQRSIYTDGMSKDHRQSWPSWLVAVATMTIYTGWMHVLLALMAGVFFRRWCLYVLLALFATTFLPAKPVLWPAFCRSAVFRTWREYFAYSFLNEALLDAKKHYIFVEVRARGACLCVGVGVHAAPLLATRRLQPAITPLSLWTPP